MTNQNNAAQPVLTDDEIRDIEANAEFSWHVPRAIERAVLSKLLAPVADTLSLEKALYELVNKIDTGLDTGDLVQDARRASTVLDAIMASGDLVACAHEFFKDCGEDKWRDRYERSIDFRIGWNACLNAIAEARSNRASAPVAGEADLPKAYIVRHGTTEALFRSLKRANAAAEDVGPGSVIVPLYAYAAPQASEAVRDAAIPASGDVTLPPLPSPPQHRGHAMFAGSQMIAYARAAVLADRQQGAVDGIAKELLDAAISLETISRLADNSGWDRTDIRLFAASRARIARAALSAQPGAHRTGGSDA